MPTGRRTTHYELLGVDPGCSFEEIRTAYRRLARQHHPDLAPVDAAEESLVSSVSGAQVMAQVNEAWRVLSDQQLRQSYDLAVRVPTAAQEPLTAQPGVDGSGQGRPPPGTRRQAWAAGVQAQMARLARLAGRSATQTLLIRSPRAARSGYEAVVDDLVASLASDVESRVRAARAAGAAPLDLGVAATLVGVRTVADSMRREAPLGVTTESLMAAELLDRMWDVLAHELPVQLTSSLGGNPQVSQTLYQHASAH